MIFSSSSWSSAGSYRPACAPVAQTSLGGERCKAPLHRFVPVLVSMHLRHTPMVPYGTLHWCHMAHTIGVNLLKNLPCSMIFRHSDGAIWHTPLVPYGTHDRCHMATGTLGVCHYGGTWCPSVAGGGGEFFVSEIRATSASAPSKTVSSAFPA